MNVRLSTVMNPLLITVSMYLAPRGEITQINMMYVCLPGAQEKGELRWWVDSDL